MERKKNVKIEKISKGFLSEDKTLQIESTFLNDEQKKETSAKNEIHLDTEYMGLKTPL